MPIASPTAPLSRATYTRRVVFKASRPSLIDLRFKGDAWVLEDEGTAIVSLGDFPLGHIAVSPLDVPTLNRTFSQVRTGQMRRNYLVRFKRPAV